MRNFINKNNSSRIKKNPFPPNITRLARILREKTFSLESAKIRYNFKSHFYRNQISIVEARGRRNKTIKFLVSQFLYFCTHKKRKIRY